MRLSTLAVLPLVGGCFHVYERPTCTEVGRTELAQDEVTASGTPAELLALVGMDATFPGQYVLGGDDVDIEVFVDQDGPASWVEQENDVIRTRSFGFGVSVPMIYVVCNDRLELPLIAEARTTDGALELFAEGTAWLDDPNGEAVFEPGVPWVSLAGDYQGARFPDSEEDPADWDDKYSYLRLDFDDEGFVEGAAGWGGYQETEDWSSSMGEDVVRFAPEEVEGSTTSEP